MTGLQGNKTSGARGDPGRPRTCVLVLGMHRSGTSALTRVLNLMGATLPKNIIGAGVGNKTGHWEPARLVALHDQLLSEVDSTWSDWRSLNLGKLIPERLAFFKQQIRNLIEEEYGNASLFVIKEPRVCRFVPLYRELLQQMGVVVRPILMIRNPLEVAASLERRNGLPHSATQLTWLRHVLDAEIGTRDLPRTVLHYDTLLADWRRTCILIWDALNIDATNRIEAIAAEVDAFLSADLRHHASTVLELERNPSVHPWVKRCHYALRHLSQRDGQAVGEFDLIANEFNPASALFASAITAVTGPMISKDLVAAQDLEDATAARQLAENLLNTQIATHRIEIENIRQQLAASDRGVTESLHAVQEAEAEVARLTEASRLQELAALTEAEQLRAQVLTAEEVGRRQAQDLKEALTAQTVEAAELVARLNEKTTILEREVASSSARWKAATIEHEQNMRNQANEIHLAYQSTLSWRLSAPLRTLASRFSVGVSKGLHPIGVEALETPPNDENRPMDRLTLLRGLAPTGGPGLEIGPSYQPAFAKRDGFDVEIADHLDAASLRAKYVSANVNIDAIEDVDYVLSEGGLLDIIKNRAHYSFVMASHVIEHIPDPIEFFNACSKLLRQDGTLVMAVPDCRNCFDVLQPLTSTGRMIDAHLRGDRRPSPGAAFDSVAYDALRGGKIGWETSCTDPISLNATIEAAKHVLECSRISVDYIDVHLWRFVPSSFRLIMHDLHAIGLTDLAITDLICGDGNEFFVRLARTTQSNACDREAIALQASREYRAVNV